MRMKRESAHDVRMTETAPFSKLFDTTVDEIYWLRCGFAYESTFIPGYLEVKTFPDSRRRHLAEQQARMVLNAAGDTFKAYAGERPGDLQAAAEVIDAPTFDESWRGADEETSAALSELVKLREGAAYEALILEAHIYGKSFPRKAAKAMRAQAERLRQMALGNSYAVYQEVRAAERELNGPFGEQNTGQQALVNLGLNATLTNPSYRDSLAARP